MCLMTPEKVSKIINKNFRVFTYIRNMEDSNPLNTICNRTVLPCTTHPFLNIYIFIPKFLTLLYQLHFNTN